MMNIITFIRKNKTTPVGELLPLLKTYDKKVKTSSIHLALVALFKNKFEGLNNRRLYELMRWLNQKFAALPSTSNVDANLSKIRQIVKAKWGYDSIEYRKSQTHLVFDPPRKQRNIADYNKRVFERNENCQPIKVSLINRLLAPTTFLAILDVIKNMNEESTQSMVNTFLQKEIGESTYFLRKCFGNFAFHLLDDPTVAKTTYLSRILGHEINNESTATCYQGYWILDDTTTTQ